MKQKAWPGAAFRVAMILAALTAAPLLAAGAPPDRGKPTKDWGAGEGPTRMPRPPVADEPDPFSDLALKPPPGPPGTMAASAKASHWYQCGQDTTFTASTEGGLVLAVNDAYVHDNRGLWEVRVSVTGPHCYGSSTC